MKAIVTGMIATYPVGGVAWDYGQYALGLERLGWEVYYLEDTGWQTYDPTCGVYGEDPTVGLNFLSATLKQLSPTLGRRWHFRAMTGQTYGMEASEFERLVTSADLFLNVSGGTLLRDAYMSCPNKVLIDSDPGWNQFVNFPKWDANPGWQGTHGYRAHDHFFTYAERLGSVDCLLPDMGLDWHPTRPPVVMECWDREPAGRPWTTVLTWNNFQKPVEYQGRFFGTKEIEFPKIEALPQHVPECRFELAVGGSSPPRERWREIGWEVVDSHTVSRTVDDYRHYIERSRGELSVAKNLYTATRSGWFSCRSVCYLAAGLPVVVQDTGFSKLIPTGRGLFAFSNLDEAIESVRQVEAAYEQHCSDARNIARQYFDSSRVLEELLNTIGIRGAST